FTQCFNIVALEVSKGANSLQAEGLDLFSKTIQQEGVKCSTSNCGSKPPGNKRNDRISQTPSRNKKNKVEAQPRKVNKMNRVVKPVCDVDVKHSLSNANSKILCATCNKSMFDGVHDKCLLDLVQNGNNRTKSAKKHKKQNIWKPTGHVFTEVGFKWKPTGRTFTIVGNSCPLTRITSTNVVSSKQTTSHSAKIQKPEIKVYSRKPKNVKNIGCPDCTLVSGLRMFETHDRESLSAHELCQVYYVEGLGHNLFSVGQFCDADLEVAFWKNTCFIGNLEGVDLLSGSRDTNLYTISLDDMIISSPIFLLSKASKTKSCLWHRRLSYLNFGTLNKRRQNQTLVEAARTMLIFSKAPLFLWVEAINTACYTQNYFLIRLRYNKTPYELMQDKKPDLSFFHVFGSLCYPTNDHEDLGKCDEKADIRIFVGYAPAKKAFRIYNRSLVSFSKMGFTLILATLDGLDVGLLGDVTGEDDCDDDG
ncbi:integrase, catalytic region, zinc finger, CCHC-type containing protein, partial [Tanacetum coccineum]